MKIKIFGSKATNTIKTLAGLAGFIAAASTAQAAITVTNTGTSTVFDDNGTVSNAKGGTISNWALNGGNAVVFLISHEDSNGWSAFTASYGSQAMTVVQTIGAAGSRWDSAIAYIINPVASTANLTFGWTTAATNSEGVYTALSLKDVASVLGSTSADSASNLPTLTLNYASNFDGGFVVGAGNNNSFSGPSGTPSSSGDLDTTLFKNIASGNMGVIHAYGDIPTAGNSSSSIGDLSGANSLPALSAAIVAFEGIPEPSAALLGGLGAMMLLRRRRN